MLSRASFATLVRKMPVRVLDVSRSGCRLESSQRIHAGTTGLLQLSLGGYGHEDDIRVARCQLREGAGASYFLGVELLPTRSLNTRSIRLAVGELIGEQESREHPPLANSGQASPDRESEQLEKGVSRAPPEPKDS
jgi:hypothetical protein